MNTSFTECGEEKAEEIYSILDISFPKSEYREKKLQKSLFKQKNYHAYTFDKDGKTVAILCIWEFDDMIFIEHFAVHPDHRNGGLGTELMHDFVSKQTKPVVLEVDDDKKEMSLRRIGFYNRLGFELTDIRYDQPDFSKTHSKVPLRLMCYPQTLCEAFAKKAENEIFSGVYKKEG